MKVTGFTDTIQFAARDLAQFKPDENVTKALKEFMMAKDPGAVESATQGLLNAMSPETKKALAKYGATLPTDVVKVNVDFGSFLYDCYTVGAIYPSAPLRVALFNKFLQDMAARLAKDSFELSDDEAKTIKKVLDDEEKWKNAKFGAYALVDGKRVDVILLAHGVGYYGKVMEAAVNLFTDEVPTPVVAPEATPKVPEATDGTASLN